MSSFDPHSSAISYAAVLEALPVVAFMARPDGSISYISDAGSVLTGHPRGTALGTGIRDLIDPADLTRALAVWAEAMKSATPYADRYRLRFADGSYHWVLSQASPLRDTESGKVYAWVGIFLDIEDQYRAVAAASQQARAKLISSEAAARALASAIPGVTWTASPDGKLTDVSAQWTRTHGLPNEDALQDTWLATVHPDDRDKVIAQWSASVASGDMYDTEFRLRVIGGSYRWFLVRALPIFNERNEIVQWVGVNLDIDDRHRADQERDRLQRGFRLLAQTGAVALTSLESVAITRLIARACVNDFASICAIDLIDEVGKWHRTSAHRIPDFATPLDDLPLPQGEHPIARVFRSQRSSVVTVTDEWLTKIEGDSQRAQVYRNLGIRSMICVPIATPSGTIVGALTCGIDQSFSGIDYVTDDLVFVEEVGRRIGSLMENLRLYERERRIAVELQAASLPVSLPSIDHLHLDAEYRPGSAEATIGGDWYDAFIVKDGRVVITVGDVLGHGLRAAVTMTKLRQAMQAAAMINPDPNVMLKVADETLKLIDPDQGYATAIALVFNPSDTFIEFASAGHPGPVIRHADGSVEYYTSPGIMLGLRDGTETDTCRVATPHGTSIVLFTDGITEATRDFQEGYDRLYEAVLDDELLYGENPAKRLVERVLGSTPASDDIAVLIASVANPKTFVVAQTRYGRTIDEFAPSPVAAAMRTSSWQFQSSDANSAHAVRHSFRAYASGSTFTEHVDVATAELVLGELIGNVVRHAPGLVTVDIEWRSDAIRVAVTNEGPVFTLRTTPQDDLFSEHGRGLGMIDACTTSLRVLPTATGGCRVEAVIPHLPT